MLRSIAKQCVSKHGAAPDRTALSFETRSFGPLLRMRAEEAAHVLPCNEPDNPGIVGTTN